MEFSLFVEALSKLKEKKLKKKKLEDEKYNMNIFLIQIFEQSKN